MAEIIGHSYGNVFLSTLGSFWTILFKQKDFTKKILLGTEFKISDLYFKFCEIILGTSINDIPIFNQKTWVQLTWLESEIDQDVSDYFLYGDDIAYDDEDVYYGGKWPTGSISLKLKNNIMDIGNFLCNKIYNPSFIMYKGKDYTIRNGVANFRENIFQNDFVPKRPIYDSSGAIIDHEISLWCPKAYIDKEYLWKRYGSLAGIQQKSSEQYKILLRTIFSLFANGPKKRFIEGFINSIFEYPIALDNETVKYIVEDSNKKTIYTANNIYELEETDYIDNLYIGKALTTFQPFYNIIKIFSSYEEPNYLKNREFISLPLKILSGGYNSPVIIKKQKVTVETRVGATFPIAIEGNVTETQKQLLENVPIMVGMPNLKVGQGTFVVNILDFILDQIKHNIFFIIFKSSKIKLGKFTENLINIFESVIPAFCTYFMLSEMSDIPLDVYNIDSIQESTMIQEGHLLKDVYEEGRITDGYWGVIYVGGGLKVGEPKARVRNRIMNAYPKITSIGV